MSGKTMASNLPKRISFWDVESGTCIGRIKDLTDDTEESCYLGAMALSATAEVLATGHGSLAGGRSGRIGLWSVPDGKEIGRFPLRSSGISALAFSPDGSSVISGDGRGGLNRCACCMAVPIDNLQALSSVAERSVQDGTLASGAALCNAASAGQEDLVRILLQRGAAVDLSNDGRTPLLLACYYEHEQVAAVLLAHGASPHATNSRGETPLHFAAEKAQTGIIELLLANGARLNDPCNVGRTPLYNAVLRGREEPVRLLLSRGADPNRRADDGFTPLGRALQKGFSEIAELLSQHNGKS